MRCPYLSKIELLWLARSRPEIYAECVEMERAKLRKFAHLGVKNYGVFKRRTLLEVLASAEAKYGHMTNCELYHYKMSHGHSCPRAPTDARQSRGRRRTPANQEQRKKRRAVVRKLRRLPSQRER